MLTSGNHFPDVLAFYVTQYVLRNVHCRNKTLLIVEKKKTYSTETKQPSNALALVDNVRLCSICQKPLSFLHHSVYFLYVCLR